LTAFESGIRDTDMASEFTDYTVNSIINQSAQAMLTQANGIPQTVLTMIQGSKYFSNRLVIRIVYELIIPSFVLIHP